MFKFKISNFRSFIDEEFDFSRINILIGENSSGKSSILKFLLALKQSLKSPISRELNLCLKGELTDLGSYKDAIYYNDENLPLTFSFDFDTSYTNYFYDDYLKDFRNNEKIVAILGETIVSNTFLEYQLTKDLDNHSSISTIIRNPDVGELAIIHYQNKEIDNDDLISKPKCILDFKDTIEDAFDIQLNQIEYEKQGFTSFIVGASLLENIKAIVTDELSGTLETNEISNLCQRYFWRIAFLLVSQNYLISSLNNIEYINPLLTKPSRIYLTKDERNGLIINDIEDVVDYLSRNNPKSKEMLVELSSILSRYGLIEGLEIIQDKRLPVKELRVKIKDLYSNIFDVGYGVSLQIPIILKALLGEKSDNNKRMVLLIEQPEVHLHPRLHAAFIEILLGLGNKNIYFIETHSEHIVRKLQSLTKQKKFNLESNDTSIHYLKRVKKKSDISKHTILEDGFLNPIFPSGFFDASYNLSKDLLD